jgi:hypothetical protein
MPKKVMILAIVPILLLAFARFGTMPIIEHTWNQVVNYRSIYATPLPAGDFHRRAVNQVVLVIVDGLRDDVSRTLPALNDLRSRGASRTLQTGQPSLSYPTWTTILSGAWQETSGVTTNWYTGAVTVDTILARAQAAGLKTAIAGSTGWDQLFAGQYDDGDFLSWQGDSTDEATLAQAMHTLSAHNPQLLIVHFNGVDEAGHAHGGASEEYRQAARNVDFLIGKLARAVDLGSGVLMVTADHGHLNTGGHGGPEPVVVSVPFVALGKGISAGSYPLGGQADIAPTVAVLLGTAFPAHNQGRPMWDLFSLPQPMQAERVVDLAAQYGVFYDAYARTLGVAPFNAVGVAEARDALQAGEFSMALRDAAGAEDRLVSQAQAARAARLGRERLLRLPLALLLLVPFAAWLFPGLAAWLEPAPASAVRPGLLPGLRCALLRRRQQLLPQRLQ